MRSMKARGDCPVPAVDNQAKTWGQAGRKAVPRLGVGCEAYTNNFEAVFFRHVYVQ